MGTVDVMISGDTLGFAGRFNSSASDGNGSPARARGAVRDTVGKFGPSGALGPETGGNVCVGGTRVAPISGADDPTTIGAACSPGWFAVC